MVKKYDLSSLDGIEKMFQDSVKELAENVLEQTELLYESVIQDFYNDYSPVWYDRTGSTFLGSSGYDNLWSSDNFYSNNGIWTTRISIGANNIPANPYRANKAWVFDRTFIKGIHGRNVKKYVFGKENIKVFRGVKGKLHHKTFSVQLKPTQTRGKWRSEKLVTVRKYYEQSARIMQSEMSNMSPAPMSLMNKGFKALTRKRNLKAQFDDIMNSKIMH